MNPAFNENRESPEPPTLEARPVHGAGRMSQVAVTVLHTQYTQIDMASKNISIPEDVYRRLAEEKRKGESFGDVLDRMMKGRPLSGFSGEWSEKTASLAEEAVQEGRKGSDEKLEELYGSQ